MIVAMYDETRLDELEYQREQVRRHLEWLDREIAAERGKNLPHAPEAAKRTAQITGPDRFSRVVTTVAATAVPVDPLMGEQPRAASDVRQDVKKGCLLYFAAAIGAVLFSVAVLYFAFGIGRR